MYSEYIVSLLAGFILLKLASVVLTQRFQSAKAHSLGCLEPAQARNKLPWGIDLAKRLSAASKAKMFPQLVRDRFEEVGAPTYEYQILGSKKFATRDPENIKTILATKFDDFQISPLRGKSLNPLIGQGIFTSNGAFWEFSRKLLRPSFTRDSISDLDLEERHLQTLFKRLAVDSKGWTGATDILPLFFRLTLDTATEFLMGHSVNSQVAELPGNEDSQDTSLPLDGTEYARLWDLAALKSRDRIRLQQLYWLADSKEYRDAIEKVHNYIDHFVTKTLEKLESKGSDKEKLKDTERYILLEALAEQTQDPVALRSHTLHILVAGRDTTAGLLSWFFHFLVRDERVLKKLRSVILDEFGTYDKSSGITFESLKSCQYLQCCVSEALRLCPLVPFNVRVAVRDTSLPRGGGPDGKSPVFVPKGTAVDYSVFAMHHDKSIWGPDAESFRPERFEAHKHSWDFLPFNGGPRICIGQQFALTEASYIICRILQKYDQFENLEPAGGERLHDLGITDKPMKVLIKLHEAKN